MTAVLLVDNYDSFVYNIAQYLGEMGCSVVVERNDSPALDDHLGKVDGYIISPGPGHPSGAGRSLEVISEYGYGRPVLGVCLGHQAIAHVHGASIVRAERVVHGKVCAIEHGGGDLFRGVPRVFSATRYHSLVVSRDALPSSIEVLAESPSGEVMALRIKDKQMYGVQFHPESVMTSHGKAILGNFMGMCSR